MVVACSCRSYGIKNGPAFETSPIEKKTQKTPEEILNALANNSMTATLGEGGGPSLPSTQVVGVEKNGPTSKVESIFRDKTPEYGLEGMQATNLYAVDFDSDGHTDLVLLPEYYSRPIFLHFNFLTKKFEKLASDPGQNLPKASFLVFADLDHDGVLDLLLGTLYQKTELAQTPLLLYRGRLNSKNEIEYQEINDAFPKGLWGPSAATLVDYNLDGKLDLFLSNWYDLTSKQLKPVPDRLLQGEEFNFKSDVSALLQNEFKLDKSTKQYLNAKPTYGASLCDIDQNGYVDILTVSSGGHSNKLWMSMAQKDGQIFYEDFGDATGYSHDLDGAQDLLGGGNGFFSLCADYNNDGIMDIFYGSQFHHYDNEKRDHSAILTGKTRDFPPQFLRTPYDEHDEKDPWTQSDRRGIWFDYNNDGLLDLLVENSGFPPYTRLVLFEQQPDHSFVDVSAKLGIDLLNPAGSVVADFNHDGVFDLVVGQSNMRDAKIKPRIYFFENQKKDLGKQSLRIYLRGQKSNAQGIGALLLLKRTTTVSRQMVQYNYGGLPSQNEEGVLFGLGKEKAKKLTISWPFEVKDKLGRTSPLVLEYSLEKLKGNGPYEITVCDSGKWIQGKKANCQ